MAHYDIFRHHLSIVAPAYGHALWDPNPGNLYPAVEVGDVGYICEGKFRRLFNALLPANHPSHRNFGVPEYHEQLTLNIENHIDIGSLGPHNFFSIGVTLGPELDPWANGPNEEGELSFSCPMNQGAVLCLPITAKREDTVASTKFGKWIIKHIDRWFAWARELELGVERMDDIILVTGTHRTRSCVNVAFPGGQRNAQVSFRAMVDHPGDIVAINWQFSHERNRGAFLNCGPEGEDLPEDQCIFIRGFRVTRKYKIFPRLKGAAGPNPDPEGYDEDEESNVELIPVPTVPEYRDPLHVLQQFIAEGAPNCDMILVHDNDLALVHGLYDKAPMESLQSDAILSYLKSAQLKIREVSFGPDLSSADNGRSADTETVRIATLSTLFEELSASSTSSSSQSRYHIQTPLARIDRALLDVNALHLAALENDSEMARLLLEQGANANAKNIQGLTPLYCAAYGGQLEVMRMLLLHGASVGARDKNGETALHLAARKNHSEMAALLLGHGAHANAKNTQELSPLYCAAYDGQEEVMRVLLRGGADVEARDKNGVAVLHLAARNNHSDIATMLLDHGANANAQNIQELTPLYYAAHEEKLEVMHKLLQCGSDVEARNENGETALHLAARKNHSAMATLLLEHGADANAKDIQELTPFYCAVYEGHPQVMRVLLLHGVDIRAQTQNGMTALDFVARKNHPEMAMLLLKHGFDAKDRDMYHRTPLHYDSSTFPSPLPSGSPYLQSTALSTTSTTLSPTSTALSLTNANQFNTEHLAKEDSLAKEDPLATQVWKMYARTKANLPHSQRMENLTWRMMQLALKKKKDETKEGGQSGELKQAAVQVKGEVADDAIPLSDEGERQASIVEERGRRIDKGKAKVSAVGFDSVDGENQDGTEDDDEIIPMDWRAMSRSRSRVPMDWRPSNRSGSRPPPATVIQFDGVLPHPERLPNRSVVFDRVDPTFPRPAQHIIPVVPTAPAAPIVPIVPTITPTPILAIPIGAKP